MDNAFNVKTTIELKIITIIVLKTCALLTRLFKLMVCVRNVHMILNQIVQLDIVLIHRKNVMKEKFGIMTNASNVQTLLGLKVTINIANLIHVIPIKSSLSRDSARLVRIQLFQMGILKIV